MFALWTWTGREPGPVPHETGETATVALVVPNGTEAQRRAGSATLEVLPVPCALVEPGAFTSIPVDRPGASTQAWRATLDGTATRMPASGHAVPNAQHNALIDGDHARTVLRETTEVATELRTQLQADLRPYQARGIGWLRETVARHGGAILADEMGLGKTVQTIGLLVGRADTGAQLVVCPTSLVGNWVHEIARFAPGLHPVAWRGGTLEAAPGTVVVTGYPMLRRHGDRLTGTEWSTAVYDEAQALKNPRTQVARAARVLHAQAVVALTGTPVENHLDELWALLHLVAPTLFGHRAQFRRRFVKPIEQGSGAAAARLRDAVEPVLLSRRKDQVAASLPAKIHADLLCDLTPEQQQRYDSVLEDAVAAGFGTGSGRQTRILAALTALKQVCNHPGLAEGDTAELAGRSGKLDLCTDIVATNLGNEAPTLIFTQYRATGELLVRHLAEQFAITAPFFHGGLGATERAAIVREFQSPEGPPVLILSLRAAGTGLTLTRAADVIHFDRWWNPAVEAQASDRVHRIGQTRTVTVTTLTSATTVEEHIAQMQRRKSAITDLGTGDGIAELARLDDERLLEVLHRKRGR